MKIIDLLNKIANGEEVPIVKFYPGGHRYQYIKERQRFEDMSDFTNNIYDIDISELNEEVEILETTITYKPDKIEYLDDFYKDDRFGYSIDLQKVKDKINELIDEVNKLKEE